MGNGYSSGEAILVYILSIWSLIWKGIAIWRAVKHNQRNWFIVMLVLNTVGILELVYLFRFSKKRMTTEEIKQWLHKTFTKKAKSE